MLELSQKILKRVSFDAYLFQKELKKAILWIKDLDELNKLKDWCLKEFNHLYPHIIQSTFKLA